MVNFKKKNRLFAIFLFVLSINFVTTGSRELNGIKQISLDSHNSKREMRESFVDKISSGLARMICKDLSAVCDCGIS